MGTGASVEFAEKSDQVMAMMQTVLNWFFVSFAFLINMNPQILAFSHSDHSIYQILKLIFYNQLYFAYLKFFMSFFLFRNCDIIYLSI